MTEKRQTEVLKALIRTGILWLALVCQMACGSGREPKEWEAVVNISSRLGYTNYRNIYLLDLPVIVYRPSAFERVAAT